MSLENTHARRKGNPYANSRSLLFRNISITLGDWRSELPSNGRRHEPPTETSRQLELFITRAYRKDRAELAINMTARWHCDCSIASICRVLRGNLLLVAVVISVVAGIGLGLGLRPLHPEYHVVAWIGIWGDLFLRMLKMIVLPLTVSCIIVGVASMESSASGKLGAITLAYAFITQLLAIIVGVILVLTIKPGNGFDGVPPDGGVMAETSYTDVFTDILRNLISDNIIKACTHTVYTHTETVEQIKNINITDGLINTTQSITVTRKLMFRDGMNIMGVIVFSMMIAVAMSSIGDRGKPLYRLFLSLSDVIMTVMKGIMWYSPLGIMSLICSALLEVDDISKAVVSVGFLMVTIVVGCFVHQLVVLPVLMAIICRRNPYTYFLGIFDGYLAGIASLSSVAAMPYLLQSIPDKLGVNRRVTQFTLPVLISVNRDGSALFIIVAVIYIAQTYAVQLGAVHLLMLMILVTVLSVTTSVIPSGSVMVIIMMSNVIQLPVTERLGLLMAVEWFNDRIRTGTNITSHGYGCAIIDSVARRTAQKVHLSLDGSDVPHDNEEVEMMCVVNIQEQEPEKLNNI